uniref:Protection of telomeres protein 1 n=1 Tax=Rhizophora mucronata TaxID=61149 RepID=A0A2P2P293_RHIMU
MTATSPYPLQLCNTRKTAYRVTVAFTASVTAQKREHFC